MIVLTITSASEYGQILDELERYSYERVFWNHTEITLKITLHWNHTSKWVLSCKLASYFQNIFLQELLCGTASVSTKYFTNEFRDRFFSQIFWAFINNHLIFTIMNCVSLVITAVIILIIIRCARKFILLIKTST